MTAALVIALSILVQLTSAVLAFRLMARTRNYLVGPLILATIFFATFRRAVSF